MADRLDVDMVVEAISKGFDKLTGDINKVGTSAAKSGKTAAAGFEQAKTGIGGLSQTVMRMGVIMGTAGAAVMTLKQAWNFAKEGAQLDFVRQKFDRLAAAADTSGDVMLSSLREVTRGMVTDSQLIASATDFMSLGLAKTEDQVVRLTRVSAALGMDMNQLVLTLANQTTMRFDQLGVAVDGFDERLKKLKDTGMDTNAAFTEAFLQQAEAQVIKVGEAADSATGKYVALQVAAQNYWDQQKRFFSEQASSGQGFLGTLARQLDLTTKIREAADKGVITEAQRWRMELNVYNAMVPLERIEQELIVAEVKLRDDRRESIEVIQRETKALEDLQAAAAGKAAAREAGIQQYRQAGGMTGRPGGRGSGMEYFDMLQRQAEAARQLERANVVLAASLAGELQGATEDYGATIEELVWDEGELVEDIGRATQKYGQASEQVADLTKKLDDNRTAQKEAAEAMKLATAEMIYQQAAAGLDASASLELARSMGLISEADYAVATAIADLRTQYDANKDGLLSLTEANAGYTDAVSGTNLILQALEESGVPVTLDNINKALGLFDPTKITEALDPEKFKAIMEAEPAATESLGAIQSKIDEIGQQTTTTASTAETEFGQMNAAADTTANTHIQGVITKVGELNSAIAALPSEKTITIHVVTVNSGGGGGGGGSSKTNDPDYGTGGQHGLDFIVPPGYPNDTFPIWTSSGERAIVLTSQQQASYSRPAAGRGGSYYGGDTFVVNNYDRKATAMSMAQLALVRKRRLNDSMGG